VACNFDLIPDVALAVTVSMAFLGGKAGSYTHCIGRVLVDGEGT